MRLPRRVGGRQWTERAGNFAMAPRPLEQDPEARSPRLAGLGRISFGRFRTRASEEHAGTEPRTLSLVRATLRIEDGLLMAFGPEGDPIPPAEFARAAAAQPDAQIALADGRAVPAPRVAAVLEAQASGPLTAGPTAGGREGNGWLEAMLGLGPQPDLTSEVELFTESSPCELTAFGRELMITIPSGRSFLIADAAAVHHDEGGLALLLPNDEAVSVADLVGRLRSQVTGPKGKAAPETSAEHPFTEAALPGCTVQILDAEIRFELPFVGSVRLASRGADAGVDPRVSIFLASGDVATMTDLVDAFGQEAKESKEPGMTSSAPADRVPGGRAEIESPPALNLPDVLALRADGTLDLSFLARALGPDVRRVISATVAGLPEGVRLSAGFDHGDRSWSLTLDDLAGLTLETPVDLAADFVLDITLRTAHGEETGRLNVRHPSASRPAEVARRLTATGTSRPIALSIEPPSAEGADPASTAVVVISAVPAGAVLSAGLDNGDGSWMLSPHELAGLTLTMPAGSPEDVTLTVTAVAVKNRAGELATRSESVRVPTRPAADRSIPLAIDPAIARANAGVKALVIRDLPQGASLSAGTYDRSIGGWVLLPRQLDGLALRAPPGTADFTLTVLGISLDAAGSAKAQVLTRLPVAVR
jgi:hypothetical protein